MCVRLASTPKPKHLYLCEDHQHDDTELLFVHMCTSHSPFAVVQNFLSNLTPASDFKILFGFECDINLRFFSFSFRRYQRLSASCEVEMLKSHYLSL